MRPPTPPPAPATAPMPAIRPSSGPPSGPLQRAFPGSDAAVLPVPTSEETR
jgi:chromosome partitioning protein